MNKGKSFSAYKLIFSILFNAAILAVALLVFMPHFEEPDDSMIAMIAEGAYGVRDWHLVYSHGVLGQLYVWLQSVIPVIRWHSVLQYAFIYFAYVSVTYVISKHKRGLVLSIVAVIATFYELYVSLQYTKTSTFVCAAGILLIFEAVRNRTRIKSNSDDIVTIGRRGIKAESTVYTVVGTILITYGTLLRTEGLFIAAVPLVGVGIIELLRTKNILSYILVGAPAVIIAVAVFVSAPYFYSMDKEWSDFTAFNKARTVLCDYRYDILDYNRYSQQLSAIDVSENDAVSILTYQFDDGKVLSTERLDEIAKSFPAKKVQYKTFANLFEHLVDEVMSTYVLCASVIFVFGIFLASIVTDGSKSSPAYIKDSRRKIIAIVIMILSCSFAIFYFEYSGRFSNRLFSSICISALFGICYMIDSLPIRENNMGIVFGGNKNDITLKAAIGLAIVLLGLNGLLYISNMNDYNSYCESEFRAKTGLYELLGDRDTLYVSDTFTLQTIHKYEVFTPMAEGAMKNLVYSGSWLTESPIVKRQTEAFGYSDSFEALRAGSENTVLLDNGNMAYKLLFLKEHYDKVYETEFIENCAGIDMYRVVEKQ